MKHFHKVRLLKLAKHLLYGKLGHDRFNFAVCHSICGTSGCAMGEAPFVFPKLCIFSDSEISFKNIKTDSLITGQFLFGISYHEYIHLFVPYGQKTHDFGGEVLPSCATKKEVARNIISFLKRKNFKPAMRMKCNG